MTAEGKLAAGLAFAVVLLGASFIAAVVPFLNFEKADRDIAALARPSDRLPALGAANFLVTPPEDAPAELRGAVDFGYRILTETSKYAHPYAGNALQCTNCHFRGGMTDGGRNGGVSLVGVGAKYPWFARDANSVVDLAERVNRCFRVSLNGKDLPAGGKEMVAVLTYLQWIGKGIPVYSRPDWLGVRDLPGSHAPDGHAGSGVFRMRCAMCHGEGGQGTLVAPPVWGPGSFSTGAGMNRAPVLASFVYSNMPRGNPLLTPAEAVNVAAFVTSQPRPRPAQD